MRKIMMEDGSVKFADSRKHQVGEWYEEYFSQKWHIVTSAEAGEVMGEYGIDKVWFHTLREATTEELAQRETAQAEWNAKTSEERTAARIEGLAERFPGLDW
jgi:hypothetical protein